MRLIIISFMLALNAMGTYGIIDTSRSLPPYGLCKKIAPEIIKKSNWCKKGRIYGAPRKPSLKYGRQTVFSGPVGKNKGWCGKILEGSNDFAAVAISTKYMNLHGNSPYSQYCGKCMCIRVVGHDETSNKYPPAAAKKYHGTVIKGVVRDMCSECDDDHIDILADRPYTQAPIDKWNPLAKKYNAKPGIRKIPSNIVYSVGVWKTEWNFVNCNTNCATYFK
jgi:hypothetical protein